MPTAKVIRIQPLSNGYNQDIEISGFKLLNDITQVDLSTAVVTSNFTPVSGSLDIIKRDTIIDTDVLVIPSAVAKGGAYIYLTFPANINFDAFQVGFGSQLEKSCLKLNISYSTTTTKFIYFEEISRELRLKYRNPYTFSALSSTPETGFPAFFNPNNYIRNTSYFPCSTSYDLAKRRLFSSNLYYSVPNNFSERIEIPVSSFLKRGKYYFEVSSESRANMLSNSSMLMSVLLTNSTNFPTFNESRFVFSIANGWNGVTSDFASGYVSQSGANGAYDYRDYTNLTGFISGFAIDTVSPGKISVVNSPYTDNFDMGNKGTYFSNALQKMMFIITSMNSSNSAASDLTFNFGQEPFKFTPPTGFDHRIGQRWEMELDPNFISKLTFTTEDNSIKTKGLVIEELDYVFTDPHKNFLVPFELSYYIKGNISTSNNNLKRKKISLLTWPELEVVRQQPSRETDGVYEFLYLDNRAYAIVSQDLINATFQPEIIAPVYPLKMED